MSVARVVNGARLSALPLALALALPLACGVRAGDPVVLTRDQAAAGGEAAGAPGAPNAGEGNAGEGNATSQGGTAPEPSGEVGPIGLCGDCTSSDECGDANDACIRYEAAHFCGRDCDDQRGCPDGYSCVELANSQLWQCVPQNGCLAPVGGVPELADLRAYILAQINTERVARAHSPLQASSCLDVLAQGSALSFARTDEPLGKYVKECDPIWPNCACGWNAQAEITIARYGLDWTTAVDRALAQNDRFTQAALDYDATDVGIGFWLSGDEAWIALSFH
jgi:hypothetical protein